MANSKRTQGSKGVKDCCEVVLEEGLMLDGELDITNITKSPRRQEVKKLVEAIKKQGGPVASVKFSGGSSGKKKKGEDGKGKEHDNASDETGDTAEALRQDKLSLRDFLTDASKAYNAVASSLTRPINASAQANVLEYRLGAKLGEAAQMYAAAAKKFYSSIANSSSLFYSEMDKQAARDNITVVEAVLGDASYGSPARALREMLIPMLVRFNFKPFPKISEQRIYDATYFQELVDDYSYLKTFTPWAREVSGVDKTYPNPRMKDEMDSRDCVDINAVYELRILPITTHFLALLKQRNVSDELLACLGEYTILKHVSEGDYGKDEDCMTADTFEELPASEQSRQNAADTIFKDWAGDAMCTPIQKSLLAFIDKWRVKSTSILSTASDEVESVGLNHFGRNKFGADLALKWWMRRALNSVFKVMIEDGMGVRERLAESISRTQSYGAGVKIYDLAMYLTSVNKCYFDKPIDDAEKFVKQSNFDFDPDVYKYLKENWAPIIKVYDGTSQRYMGESKMGSPTYRATIIPKLILPVNPYDTEAKAFVDNDTSMLPEESAERSPMFKRVKLPHAYLDQRNKQTMHTLTLHFDNMLSHALYLTMLPGNKFNKYTWGAVLNKAKKAYRGPHCVLEPKTGTNSPARCFRGDMYASDIDRTVKLGFDSSSHYPSVGQTENAYCTDTNMITIESSDCDDIEFNRQQMCAIWPYMHTNPLCWRFVIIAKWLGSDGSFKARWGAIMQNNVRFATGVLQNSAMAGMTMSTAVGKAVLAAYGVAAKTLSIEQAYRYSIVKRNGAGMSLFDNKMAGKDAKVFEHITGDANTPSNQRQIQLYGTRRHDVIGYTRDKVLAALVDHEGILDPFHGVTYENSAWVGDAPILSTIHEQDISEAMLQNADFLNRANNFIKIDRPFVKSCRQIVTSGAHAGTVDYGTGIRDIKPMTKVIACSSTQGLTTDSTGMQPRDIPLTRTLGADSNQKIGAWGKSIKQWNESYPDIIIANVDTEEFNSIIDYIFSTMPTYQIDCETGTTQGERLVDVKYSFAAVCKINACHSVGGKNEADHPVAGHKMSNLMHLDPSVAYITGAAQVFGHNGYGDKVVTSKIMKQTGQVVIDAAGTNVYNYCDEPPCGDNCRLNAATAYIDLRKTLYKSPLPELNNENNYNFNDNN